MGSIQKAKAGTTRTRITQKALAEHLGLHPSTVSLVLNSAPLAAAIPEETRERILRAARELDYRPNLYAKYLASNRSFTVAILLPAIGEGYSTAVLGGIDQALFEKNYAFFLAIHHGDRQLMREYPRRLVQRAVEGFILLNTPIEEPLGWPTVSIGGYPAVGDMTRVLINNYRGARMAAEHLIGLGHRNFAVIKGHAWRPASEERWRGIADALHASGIKLNPRLVLQLKSASTFQVPATPEEGYLGAKALLKTRLPFTALLAFNDLTALGAMRAFHEAGLSVPADMSVVGFDDIPSAAYHLPGLTTLRQPLHSMGELAGTHLLRRIAGAAAQPEDIVVEPELIVRESTRAI